MNKEINVSMRIVGFLGLLTSSLIAACAFSVLILPDATGLLLVAFTCSGLLFFFMCAITVFLMMLHCAKENMKDW